MSEFLNYSFMILNTAEREELISDDLNLIIHVRRYEGMGWVDI